MEKERINTIQATDADYEKAEMDQLRDTLKRTHKERFLMMTTLVKMNIMFRRAKITRYDGTVKSA